MTAGLDPLTRTNLSSGTGDVVGPSSAVNNRIAVFDGTTGKLIKDGGSTIAEIVAGSGGLVTSVFGRTGNVVAATNDYTWAQIDKTTSSLGDLTTRSAADLSSGTLLAARMPALTGDVTTSLGTVSTTIANNVVTLAKMAQMATASFLGRNTAGTGIPEVLPIATAQTMLGLSGTNTGDVTLAGENYLSIAGQVITANAVNLAGSNVTSTLPVTKGGTGTATQFTAGSIVFAGGSGVYAEDNANLFWDDSSNRLGIGTAGPTQKLEVAGSIFVNAATANLFLKDSNTGWQSASTLVVTPLNNNSIRTTNYTSGLVGWNASAAGDAEFNNIDVRGSIRASIFTFNSINATAGTLGVFKSAAKLKADAVVPSSVTYGTTTMVVDVVDPEGIAHVAAQMFAVNDIIQLKSAFGTTVGSTWLRVHSASDQTTYWSYGTTIMAGTANVTYRAGMGVVDYGPSGQGFIIQTADQTNSPYLQMATHLATFTSADASGSLIITPRLRIGNLNGSYGYAADTFGFATGQYGTAGQSWATVDATNGVRLGNNVTTRIHLAADGSGFLASNNITWDTSGNATIASWTINSNRISNGTTHIAANFDIPAPPVAWFGRTTANVQGVWLQDAASRALGLIINGNGSYPVIQIYDGTRYRVVIGGLNFAWGSDGATNSMGMKIWNSSGTKLVEFSDTQNIISGWTIGSTKISSTGIDINSGASAGLAFGATPPTGPSVGTGVWLDQDGLRALTAGTVTASIGSAGVRTFGNNGLEVRNAAGTGLAFRTLDASLGVVRSVIIVNTVGTGNNGRLDLSTTAAIDNSDTTFRINSVDFGASYFTFFNDTGPDNIVGVTIGSNVVPALTGTGPGLHITGNSLRIQNSRTPASASATGNQGEIAWDSGFFYCCTASNTWKRVAIATW